MSLNDSRGVAAVEIVAVVVVIAVITLIGIKVMQAKNQAASNPTAAVTSQPKSDTDTASDAIISDADNEAAAGNQASKESSEVTATSSAAAGIEGSYNENSF